MSPKLKAFAPALTPPTEIGLSDNSRQVLHKRYLRRGLDGKPAETIEGMFRRVARAVAEPDGSYGYDAATTEESFYALLTSLRFFPNSPTFTGAGTPLGQLAACFVLPISDDMGRRSDGIFQTLRDAALIQQTGGGNGFSFSRLRPKGDSVASSAGVATGPVGFLQVYDIAFGEVAQGGTRRGANMAVLQVDHPDIEQFVSCKEKEGQISNFNISVGITDAFMQAVEADADFPLVNPRDGQVWRTVRARDLFDKIVTYAHHNGEPGALFLDAANRSNPVPHLYTAGGNKSVRRAMFRAIRELLSRLGQPGAACHRRRPRSTGTSCAKAWSSPHASWTTWSMRTSTCRPCRNCANRRCAPAASAWASWGWAT